MFPERSLRFSEALRVAELQAGRLLDLTGVEAPPVPNEVVSELPRIRIQSGELPTSGMSYWDGQDWLICLNRREPITRQRFTLLHEFKHIIDHNNAARLYTGGRQSSERQAEIAADYFAGCVLMPRTLLKRAWAAGVQSPAAVARFFEVSERAAEVRLVQVGLLDSRKRHAPRQHALPPRRANRYFRALSASWPVIPAKELAL
jgi:Zn-dependent peptidase ImmA (M78 family)